MAAPLPVSLGGSSAYLIVFAYYDGATDGAAADIALVGAADGT